MGPTDDAGSLDIIIPVHGEYATTAQCLESLGAQTREHGVIVVDDASPDDTAVRLRQDFPDVPLVSLSTNVGFGGAVNAGIAASDADYVIVLNNDVLASSTLVEEVQRAFADPDVGSVAPVLLRTDGTVDAFGIVVDRTLAGFLNGHGQPEDQLFREPVAPYGAMAAYRRTALDEVGTFDPSLFMYGEELDLGLRLQQAGWGCHGLPVPLGVHLGGKTIGKGSPRQRYLAGFGRGYIVRKFRVLHSRAGLRTLLTEAIVCLNAALVHRETASFRGRLDGWRAARRGVRLEPDVPHLSADIGLWTSLSLRRGRERRRPSGPS